MESILVMSRYFATFISLEARVNLKQKAVIFIQERTGKKCLSEVGFEPTPTEVDCDLNAAP